MEHFNPVPIEAAVRLWVVYLRKKYLFFLLDAFKMMWSLTPIWLKGAAKNWDTNMLPFLHGPTLFRFFYRNNWPLKEDAFANPLPEGKPLA